MSLLGYLLVGLVAIMVAGVVLSVVGTVFGAVLGLGFFLLFKVAPIVLIGYVVVRLLGPKKKEISEADRKWLEG